MRVTVLGKSPAWQDADGACSGYLVERDDVCLLLECGNGVFGKLRQARDYTTVDAVVISHMHADHFFDLIPYAFALIFSPRQQPVPVDRWPGTDSPARPDLHLPAGGLEIVRAVGRALGDEGLIERAFTVHEYSAADLLSIGSIEVTFAYVPHFTDAYAVGLSGADCGRFVYGSDCRPSDELVTFADGADILMLEATLPRPERDGVRGHLTPSEAGTHAHRAHAAQLVLTHVSDELDELWVKSEAERAFGGPVAVARGGDVYTV